MCGIVGALLRSGSVTEGLIEGLSVLEYRGYDSAGVAVAREQGVEVCKRRGRLAPHIQPPCASSTMTSR